MADEMARLHPLAAMDAEAGSFLTQLAPMGRFSLRLQADVNREPFAALGLALPMQACRAAQSDIAAALWLGPGEWLLLTSAERAAELEAALRAALAGQLFSLVDVSHRQTGIGVAGPQAALILNGGCPLDLDLTSFPVGMCTRTVFAKAEVMLWRPQSEQFHLEVWRSFAPYVWELLGIMGAEIS